MVALDPYFRRCPLCVWRMVAVCLHEFSRIALGPIKVKLRFDRMDILLLVEYEWWPSDALRTMQMLICYSFRRFWRLNGALSERHFFYFAIIQYDLYVHIHRFFCCYYSCFTQTLKQQNVIHAHGCCQYECCACVDENMYGRFIIVSYLNACMWLCAWRFRSARWTRDSAIFWKFGADRCE